MNAYTLGLSALVLVLLVVLWLRRPRRHTHHHTVEELIQHQLDGNEQLVEVLRGKGVDLNSPRQLDVEFWVPSEDAARRLAASLEPVLPGTADITAPPSGRETWALTYVVRGTVSALVQPGMVERFVRLADAVGGQYDGWGTPLDPTLERPTDRS